MNPSVFLNNFRLVSRAPNGLRQLRNVIRNLAIQGRLVPQQASDTPVQEFLNSVSAHKEQTESANRRQSRSTNLGQVVAGGFSLPKNWTWAFFGDVVVNRDGERVPLSKSIRTGHAQRYDYYGASGVIDQVDDFIFDKPLLLIGEDGANLLNRSTPIAFIATGKYWVNNHAHVLDGVTLDFLRYLELYINSISLEPYVTGTAQPKMNQAKMNSIPVAIPPLQEQQRIVAKVDELMGLCDRLESQLAERAKLLPLLSQANHDRFVEEPTEENLKAIFQQSQVVDPNHLSGTVLDLAVGGLLASHLEADGDAETLRSELNSVRDALAAIEGIRFPSFPAVDATTSLPPIPEHWCWMRMGEVTAKIGSGSTPRGGSKVYAREGVPFLRSQNIWNDGIRLDDVVYIPEEVHAKMRGTQVQAFDVLLNITGASLGRCTVVPEGFTEANVSQHVTIIRPLRKEMCWFIHIFLLSPRGQSMIWERQVGMAREGLSKKILEQFEIPLPPLGEQSRIDEKVRYLLTLCGQLASQLESAQRTAGEFAASTVVAMTASDETESKVMKPPKVEVLSSLMIPDTASALPPDSLAALLTESDQSVSAKELWARSGLEIETFYMQLKTEIAKGWIAEPEPATVKEVEAD